MLYTDLAFRKYFHKYLVFEVDNFTDKVKDIVDVDIDDNYILCTNYIDKTGKLVFPVLSIGNDINDCNKGIEIDKPLYTVDSFIMANFNAYIIEPSIKQIEKAYKIIKENEIYDDFLSELRDEKGLDFVRNPYYPDRLLINNYNQSTFEIRLDSYKDSILKGVIIDNYDNEINGSVVRVIPYSSLGEDRILTIIEKDDANIEELEKIDEFVSKLNKNINKFNIKNYS